jgi:hypothetical protein
MAESVTVNVNEIMKEIRNDIQEKGYTNDMLSFDDVIVDVGTGQVTKFDKVKFNEEIFNINHEWNVQGGKVSVFFKKVIRRLVYFFVEPIVLAQDGFNASLVRMMNQMNCYIDEQNEQIKELKEKIDELEKTAKKDI